MNDIRAVVLVVAAGVTLVTAQNSPLGFLQNILGQKGGLSEILNPVLGQLGINGDDLNVALKENERARRFRDNVADSREFCAGLRDHEKTTFGGTCSSLSIDAYVFEELTGAETTLDAILTPDWQYIEDALYMCKARRETRHYSWTDISDYLNTADGRRNRQRVSCLTVIQQEKRMCAQMSRLLCSFTKGEPLECRRAVETQPFRYATYDMRSLAPRTRLGSLKQIVTDTDFPVHIAHKGECDQISNELETQALLAERERERAEQRARETAAPQPQADTGASASVFDPDTTELEAQLAQSIAASRAERTRDN